MSEALTNPQRASLHAALLALRESLSETLRATQQATEVVVLDQSAVGRVSRIDAIQQQAMAKEQQRRTALRLKQVDVALRAHEDGEYGWCKRCGEAIQVRRLEARPETVVCVPCMREIETNSG